MNNSTMKPYQIDHLGVAKDYEYSATHKREGLTLWTGPFASVKEGEALSLPRGDGYMITTDPGGAKIRVTCPTPRTDENYREIDEALRVALNKYYETSGHGALEAPVDAPESAAEGEGQQVFRTTMSNANNEPADSDEVLHHITVADVETLHGMVLTEDQAEQVKDRLAQALTNAINEIRS